MATWRGSAMVASASGRVAGVVFARSGGRQTIRACCRGRGFEVERRGPGAVGNDDVVVNRIVSFKRARDRWVTLSPEIQTWWAKHFGGEVSGRQAYVSWWSRTDAYYCQFGLQNPYAGQPHFVQACRSGLFAGVELISGMAPSYRVYWNLLTVGYPFVDVWVRRSMKAGRVGGVRRWCGCQYVTDSGWFDWTSWLQGSPRNMVFQAGEVVRVELRINHHYYATASAVQAYDVEVT